MQKFDYLIVGLGIAGTGMARSLELRGKRFCVLDHPHHKKATNVAAGMFNPIVFRRLQKSWMADSLLPFAKDFYTDLENTLHEKFYFPKAYFKLLAKDEASFWESKWNEPQVSSYMEKQIYHHIDDSKIRAPHGTGQVKAAGFLDTFKCIDSYETYLLKNNQLKKEVFDYKQLVITENAITYKDYTADRIIFCEGWRGTENPYFSYLPFKLTKGEVIEIKCPELDIDYMFHKGLFVVPKGDNIYKVGATYEWDDLNEVPTEEGRNKLEERLRESIKLDFDIISHEAGIRPTISDRRPIIGLHPEYKRLGIFNGMGTKGIMIAPYFSHHFVDFLEEKIPSLNNEVDISRFIRLYK